MFTIQTRCPDTLARTGTLHLAHGEVHTPAFVPLATKGAVRTLEPRDVEALGYEMVLGNTFHLFLQPGHELVRRLGGLHEFMRWGGPIITDSGGFQVFSMGHGNVADEIKGRGRPKFDGAILSIEEEGVRFRSYVDGAERYMAPETSMEIQAALNSDIALVFDECTPFHVTRDYTARSTERTHRWLERCLRWHMEHGPPGSGRLRDRPGRGGAGPPRGVGRHGGGQRLRRDRHRRQPRPDKPQMYEVVAWTTHELERLGSQAPRHLLGIGEVDDLIRGVELGHRHLRLCDADPSRAPRGGAGARTAGPLARRSDQVPVARVKRADHGRMRLSDLRAVATRRAYLHHLLRVGRADRDAADHPAQPELHRRADGRPAARDRRGQAAGGGRRRSEQGRLPAAGLTSCSD